MSRRIDIELTSASDDSWTWRAIGAREPKGLIAANLLPKGVKVGDEFRVEADFFVDGIEITLVLPVKGARKEPDFLEVLGSGRDQGGVTTSLAPKGSGGRGGRGGRDGERGGGRGGRDNAGGDRDNRGGRRDNRSERSGGAGTDRKGPRGEGRSQRPERPAVPAKPKPKRLRARRIHRDAALAALPPEQRPIAEQVLRGGLPGVRKAVEEQNTRNKTEGRSEINPDPLLGLAETQLPGLKDAEWHDRADAALAGMADLDLRDLRSVVVAAESAARTDETRALAQQVQEAVAARVDQDQAEWLNEITESLGDDRTVRALRMSSRPPKAGAPLPPEVSSRLTEAANAALAGDTGPQRWGTVLDAVAYAPIRLSVIPAGIPSRPTDELLETVKRLSTRVPQIAALFGIEPQEPPRKRRRSRGSGRGGSAKPDTKAPSAKKAKDAPQSVDAASGGVASTAKADPVDTTMAPPAQQPDTAAPAESPAPADTEALPEAVVETETVAPTAAPDYSTETEAAVQAPAEAEALAAVEAPAEAEAEAAEPTADETNGD
jgi:hypothetical protein